MPDQRTRTQDYRSPDMLILTREKDRKRNIDKEIGDRDSTSPEVQKHCIRQTMAQHKVLVPQQSAETVTKVTAHIFYTTRPTIGTIF